MVIVEVILMVMVVLALLLAVVAWLTRPIWQALWKRHQDEERLDHLAAERARQQAEADRRYREAASAEVRTWTHADEPDEESETTRENRT